MKILLVQPPKAATVIGGEDVHVFEPLDLEYIAAGVADRHEVRILDMRLEKKLQANLEEFSPRLVGITGYTPHVNTVKQLCAQVKEWNPDTLTVVGGHHATLYPADFRNPHIDVIVVGEGVFALREIADAWEKGKKHLEGILKTHAGEKTGILEAPLYEDLDAFPFPRRDLTRKYRQRYHSEWMKPLASMVTSKGCPFKCNFCALWKLTDGKYLKRSPESIVKELRTIEEKYVFFADAESFVDEERMEALADLIAREGIRKKYYLYSRSDTVVKFPGLIRKWRDIGLARVFVGFEFFRDEDLLDVHKESSIKDNEKAIKILRDLGLEIIASFLVKPEFDKSDFKAFAGYCRRLKLNPVIFSVLSPLPGTDFYDEARSRLITSNYDHFDLAHPVLPTRLPLKEFYREYARMYKKVLSVKYLIAFYGKYKLKEIPRAMLKFLRVYGKLKGAYKNYPV